ncbi:hypothetical protein AVEN_165417-1 [Araneus ventricosus]|uniref:Uncharacterized protein n=1 Tax=Araneus ventricosus TaxID=182803 RepID=A0A4Y2AVM1_ARAVE|nr:hypothetical protein AVEN_165417-1 [Araneus ventricosus]
MEEERDISSHDFFMVKSASQSDFFIVTVSLLSDGFTIVGVTAVLLTTVGCNCGVLEIKGGVTQEFSTEEYERPGCGVLSITIFRAS